jgi:hypothetical protein
LASKIPLDFTETVLVARVTRKQGFHVVALTPPMRAISPAVRLAEYFRSVLIEAWLWRVVA